jgi:hypothetical protein
MAEAIEQIVSATVASLRASDVDHIDDGSRRSTPLQPRTVVAARKRKENPAG